MIRVEDTDKLDEICKTLAVRTTKDENDNIYFNQQDMINILDEISKELTREEEREGFDFAIQFIQRMEI